MSRYQNPTEIRDRTRSLFTGPVRLVCPHCSTRFTPDSQTCPDCRFAIGTRHGIPSTFDSATDGRDHDGDPGSRWLDDRTLEQLADLVERTPIREATSSLLADHENRAAVLQELYDVQRDAWRTLVADRIGGRCLDVGAGFGRRSLLLAELSETVYATDPSLSQLRIVASRDDYASSDRVIPLHTTAAQLPFAPGSFDTIVTDLSRTRGHARDERTHLSRLRELLDETGTLCFTADGWPKTTGLTSLAGLEGNGEAPGGSVRPGTADGYRSLARTVGFDHVSVYALVPNATRPLFVFDVDDSRAVEQFADFVVRDAGRFAGAGKRLLRLGDRSGLLKQCYPSYLVVCTDDTDQPASKFTEPLLKSGRARSVVLESSTDGDGVERVWKFPNRAGHAPLTERENTVLASLTTRDEPITETLPDGDSVSSRFGAARTERPVIGEPLSELLEDDPESFGRVLRLGLEWLAEFQRTFRGDRIERSPATIRKDLEFDPAGVEAPSVTEPLELFFAPVHGDFMSQNIYTDEGEITTVIDWEYGAADANPIIDAGLFLLDVASQLAGNPVAGLETVLAADSEYIEQVRDCVGSYCDTVGLSRRAFELYLPAAYLHRLELDWRFDTTSTYSTKMEERAELVEQLFDRRDQLSLEPGTRD